MIEAFAGARRALGPGPYRTYMLGNVSSLIGTWVQRVAVGYLTWELTHSATWLGVMAMADLAPSLVVGPFAGVFADRVNRQRLLRITLLLGLVQALGLAMLQLLDALPIAMLFLMTLTQGVVNATAQPARMALISAMVPRDIIGSAVAINAISFNLARFIGPVIAGILIYSFGVTAAFGVNAASFAIFIILLSRLPVLTQIMNKKNGAFRRDLLLGFSYVRGHRATAYVMLIVLVTGMASRPVNELLPGFSDRVFNRGADGLAMMTAAIGLGAMAGSAWVVTRPAGRPLARPMLNAACIGSLAVMGFTLSNQFELALLAITIAGFCWTITGVLAQTLVQLGVPDEVRGRVLSIFGLILKSGPAVGAIVIGSIADVLGLQSTVAAFALMALIFILCIRTKSGTIAAAFEPRVSEN